MIRPIVEQNAARPHPAAEPRTVPPDDTVTIRAIKGKGLVATITPHFAIAVIVGVSTAMIARKPDPVSESVAADSRRCNEEIANLRSDLTQFKAMTELHNQQIERDINQLLARGAGVFREPSIQPSPIASGVASELLRGPR